MPATERPVGQILQEIVDNLQDIVRSEVRLARTEVREEAAKARSASLFIVLGAASGFFSVFFVLLTLVYALGLVIASWAAALGVAFAAGAVAGIALRAGLMRFRAIHPAAPKTRASVKESVEWVKRQIR
jgi:hypothetical protein